MSERIRRCAVLGVLLLAWGAGCGGAGESRSSVELCNGVDDNGDGQIDEGLGELSCGVGACARTVPACLNGVPNTCTSGQPSEEKCNGKDDDCDGEIDEEIQVPTCGLGACERPGDACVNGKATHCTPGEPSEEVCNGKDDDCDGEIDEGELSCGVGACARTVPACLNGKPNDTCAPGTPSAEVCNGKDDDCDGEIDEGLGELSCGVGACARTVPACLNGKPNACAPGQPKEEKCNGKDDDCDGKIDEELVAVTCGLGACERPGDACVNGKATNCTPGAPAAETCNGIDDDCDGETDNGLGELSCGVGACARTVPACLNGKTNVCVPGLPTAEVCNGVDDDCDGTIDEDLGVVTCGVGACARLGESCVGGKATSCTPGQPTQEICNNSIDDDCDGQTDEGCVAPEVVRLFPAEGSVLTSLRPEVFAELYDETYQGIDKASIRLSLDGMDVTGQAVVTQSRVTYKPGADLTVGQHVVVLEVADVDGNKTVEQRNFEVAPASSLSIMNRLDGVETAVVGEAYSLAVEVQGTEPWTFSLSQAPAGMTADPKTGRVSWTPAAAQGGEHKVTVRVADSQGTTAERTFVVRVATLTSAASAMISAAQGGKVEVTDPQSPLYGAALEIPAGALSQDTQITISAVGSAPPGMPEASAAGPVLHLGPHGTQFSKRVTLTLPYDAGSSPGLGTQLFASTWTTSGSPDPSGDWTLLDLIEDDGSGQVNVELEHLSLYDLFWSWQGVGVFDSAPVAQDLGVGMGVFKVIFKLDPTHPDYLKPANYTKAGSQVKDIGTIDYSLYPQTVPAFVVDLAYALEYSYAWYKEAGYPVPVRDSDLFPISVRVKALRDPTWKAAMYAGSRLLEFSPTTGSYEDLLVYAAHEMFHVVQDQRGMLFGGQPDVKWLIEGTADHMPDKVWAQADFDWYQAHRIDKAFTMKSLDAYGGAREYQALVYFKYRPQVVPLLFSLDATVVPAMVKSAGSLGIMNSLSSSPGGLPADFLEFTHNYNYRFDDQIIEEISEWKWQLGRTPVLLVGTETEDSAVSFKKTLGRMAGETFVGSLGSGGSLAEAFKGRYLTLKVNRFDAGMLGQVCKEPDCTSLSGEQVCKGDCTSLSGPIEDGTVYDLGLVETAAYQDVVVSAINGEMKSSLSAVLELDVYFRCTGEVQGVVQCKKYDGNLFGVPGVTMSATEGTDAKGNGPVEVTTDKDGKYLIGSAAEKVYFPCDLKELGMGANRATASWAWPSAPVKFGDTTLGSTAANGETVLPAQWFYTTVTGKVIDDGGKAVDGATVTIDGIAGNTATTANGGLFELKDVNVCGVTQIVARAKGGGCEGTSSGKAPNAGGVTDLGVIDTFCQCPDLAWDSSNPQTMYQSSSVGISVTGGKPPYIWKVETFWPGGMGFSLASGSTNVPTNTLVTTSYACGIAKITVTPCNGTGKPTTGYVRSLYNSSWVNKGFCFSKQITAGSYCGSGTLGSAGGVLERPGEKWTLGADAFCSSANWAWVYAINQNLPCPYPAPPCGAPENCGGPALCATNPDCRRALLAFGYQAYQCKN